MLSKLLDLQNQKVEAELKKTNSKKPATAFTMDRKQTKQLPNDLKDDALETFKEVLCKVKEKSPDTLDTAPLPLPPELNPSPITNSDTALKIEPSVQLTQIYHKMVETLLFIHQEGIQETTFFLDGEAFSSSLFEGARITITEYSTAPKVFNIEFSAGQLALNVFEGHAAELVSAFQNGHFGFEVHRIDTSLLSENDKYALRKVEREENANEGEKENG